MSKSSVLRQKFIEAEVMAAVISGMFTVFVESRNGDIGSPQIIKERRLLAEAGLDPDYVFSGGGTDE